MQTRNTVVQEEGGGGLSTTSISIQQISVGKANNMYAKYIPNVLSLEKGFSNTEFCEIVELLIAIIIAKMSKLNKLFTKKVKRTF